MIRLFLALSVYLLFFVFKSLVIDFEIGTKSLVDFEHLQCLEMFEGNKTALSRGALFNFNDDLIIQRVLNSKNRCYEFQSIFKFFERPLSTEELEFPLAYGMLVHDNFVQISFLLSALYQPQNQFCIAIDGKSKKEFIELIRMLSNCYPNIHYFVTDPIAWCGYEILTSVFKCVEFLANLKNSQWKYFQYLSGVDAPLKSNFEMVRIFKALNGTFNFEVNEFEWYRLNRKRPWNSPLPLFKTSLSATFSRESANFMITNKKVLEEIEFLRGTLCADESLWATIAGNTEIVQMPGGFDGRRYLKSQRFKRNNNQNYVAIRPDGQVYNVTNYYVARYQQYSNRPPSKCKGYYYRLSCVFGVYDLPNLVRRHELIVHKLYFNYQPAAFLCLVENSRRKSLNPDQNFKAIEYKIENIPNSPIFI